MTSLSTIKNSIQSIKPVLMSKYGIAKLYIFGSYARKEQNEKSDIDILVEFKKIPDLLTFIEMEEYMSRHLHRKVDLVPKRNLKTQIREQVLKEAIAV